MQRKWDKDSHIRTSKNFVDSTVIKIIVFIILIYKI